ncbi:MULTISPECIES: ABC transporter permease [Halorubrum]|uniref:ABC transporter permease n=1 Tax=Halorubrum TaxID=56688 RepID=UPI0009B5AE51|nr:MULTISPECIES: ABC transporter permease subunit [Halorubrum]TKX66580.1 hypothetical protein EXE40_15750 [Halorubrum sp. GN11GM_10-3_MGM]
MNWHYVARTDLRGLIRSKLIWLATAIVAGVCGLATAVPALVTDSPSLSYTLGVETLFIALGTVVPFVALGLGHRVIAGARESGTMRFLLGLPNRRLDIVLGMALSRVAATIGVAGSGGIVGLLMLVGLYDSVPLGPPLLVVLGLITVGVVYAVVGVAISASVDSSTGAVGGAFGAYVVLFFFWERIPQAVYWLVNRSFPGGDTRPSWFAFLTRLNPGTAIGDITVARFEWMRNAEYVSVRRTSDLIEGDTPFYLSEPAGVVVVLTWVVASILIGYWSFREQ